MLSTYASRSVVEKILRNVAEEDPLSLDAFQMFASKRCVKPARGHTLLLLQRIQERGPLALDDFLHWRTARSPRLPNARCRITQRGFAGKFLHRQVNNHFRQAFHEAIRVALEADISITLCQHDLFHGHLFLADTCDCLGVLFHAMEYPRLDVPTFSHVLGYCQQDSKLVWNDDQAKKSRNILYVMTRKGCTIATIRSDVIEKLTEEAEEPSLFTVPELYTMDEDALGSPVADIVYLPRLHGCGLLVDSTCERKRSWWSSG